MKQRINQYSQFKIKLDKKMCHTFVEKRKTTGKMMKKWKGRKI